MPPTPKDPSTRVRRNKTATKAVLKRQTRPKVPALPTGTRWHPQVRDWWKRAWSSPMVSEWTDSDVDALYIAAKLMQAFWDSETEPQVCKALAAEVRMIMTQCGLTPMARRSLQWEIERPDDDSSKAGQGAARKVPAKKAAPARPDPRTQRRLQSVPAVS